MNATTIGYVRASLVNYAACHPEQEIKMEEYAGSGSINAIHLTTKESREESCFYSFDITRLTAIATAHGANFCIQTTDDGGGLEMYFF